MRPSQDERGKLVQRRQLVCSTSRVATQARGARDCAQDSGRPGGCERDNRACRHVSPTAQICRGSSSCVGRRALRRARRTDRSKIADRSRFGRHSSEPTAWLQALRARRGGRPARETQDRRRQGPGGHPGSRGCRSAGGRPAPAATSSSASDNLARSRCYRQPPPVRAGGAKGRHRLCVPLRG